MKKLLALSLATTMALALFAGCGSTAGTSSTATGESTASAETSATATANINQAIFDKIQPLSDTVVNYTFVTTLQPNQIDYNNMEFFKELEARTNVHITWECYPSQSYSDQKNLMLSANQVPDAFFGSGAVSMDDINKYSSMGMFVNLDSLIAENCPNYTARLKENSTLDGISTAFDGSKYSFGTVNENETRNYPDNLYINKTWLDKLGLAVPTTLDEYYDVLKAFKTQDPNGNGVADEIPYTFNGFSHINGYGSFFGAYGPAEAFNYGGSTLDNFAVINDKVTFLANTQEYKDAINGLSRFFTDGLFDQEGFVQDSSQFKAKGQSDPAIVGSFYGWSAASETVGNADQYVAIAPLKATATSADPQVHERMNHINVLGTGFTITSKAKNPEILAKWVDLFYDTDLSLMAHFGVNNLIPQSDGSYKFDETPSADGSDYMSRIQYTSPYDGAPQYISADEYGKIIPVYPSDQTKMDVINEYYKPLTATMTLPNINFTPDEIKFNTASGTDIQNYVKEMQSKWLLGERDINKDWDSYLAQLTTYNLDQYVAQMQTAYDRTEAK